MRRFFQRILTKPVAWLASRFSSKPNLQRVLAALTALYKHTQENPGKKGLVIDVTVTDARFIVFSDQHKGAKDGSDDFMLAEPVYLTALNYYLEQDFHLISLGDEEELWENTLIPVKANNKLTTALQNRFLLKDHYTKVFGNHDIFWNNDPFAIFHLKDMYEKEVVIYEAVLLRIQIGDEVLPVFLTHGHQGDGQSDGNMFSAWFVGRVWAPLQSYLSMNLNTPASDDALKTAHNLFMCQWSKQEENPVLITGHTHQPVFASLTHLENLYHQLDDAEQHRDAELVTALKKEIRFRQQDYDFVRGNYTNARPYYFNTGCCCFSDGDITGIEIADGFIRLIKWKKDDQSANRIVLQEMLLKDLL